MKPAGSILRSPIVMPALSLRMTLSDTRSCPVSSATSDEREPALPNGKSVAFCVETFGFCRRAPAVQQCLLRRSRGREPQIESAVRALLCNQHTARCVPVKSAATYCCVSSGLNARTCLQPEARRIEMIARAAQQPEGGAVLDAR